MRTQSPSQKIAAPELSSVDQFCSYVDRIAAEVKRRVREGRAVDIDVSPIAGEPIASLLTPDVWNYGEKITITLHPVPPSVIIDGVDICKVNGTDLLK